MHALPSVTIIVLIWNSRLYVADCLAAVQALNYPDLRIVVVDNGSSDGSADYVRTHFPMVELIASERNRGYAGGNNLGLLTDQSDISVILNPDVIVPPGWLQSLVAPMMADPSIGVAGALLHYPDGNQIQHAGGQVLMPLAFTRHIGGQEDDHGQCRQLIDVDYVIGAAMAIRRPVVAAIGGFDETFFLYYEDVEYCCRARTAGWRVVYVPTLPAVHAESTATGKESQFYLEHLHAGRWRFLLKQIPFARLVADCLPAERAWLDQRSWRERRALVRAYRHVIQDIPRLWGARSQEASSTMSEQLEQQTEIARHLAALAKDAADGHTLSYTRATALLQEDHQRRLSDAERRLHAASYVVEQPLRSHAPVVGRLLTWLRNSWNNVATTWYVRPLLQQQNDYNALLYQRLEELTAFQREMYEIVRETHTLLEGLSERAVDDDRDVTQLARRVGELDIALVQLEKRFDRQNGA